MMYMKKVVIVGGAGFLGTALTDEYLKHGYDIVIVDLRPSEIDHKQVHNVNYNILDVFPEDFDNELMSHPDIVINLAGKSIYGRFTKKHKQLIYDTRVIGSQNLVSLLKRDRYKPKRYVAASAIGYYGNQPGVQLTEDSPQENGLYLSTVVHDWEQENLSLNDYGVPTTCIRNGHIIGNGGLARTTYEKIVAGIVPVLGSGETALPWIDIRDLCRLYHLLSETETGPRVVNGVSNTYANQEMFSRSFAPVTKARRYIHIPRWLMRIPFGSFADEMLVDLQVFSSRYDTIGFEPRYQVIKESINYHFQ